MASIREIYRTGYAFKAIEHSPAESGGTSKLVLARIPGLGFNSIHPSEAPSVIASDLEVYLMERLYGTEIGGRNTLTRATGDAECELKAVVSYGSTEERTWAWVNSKSQGRQLEIILPAESDSLYPDVGVDARIQRQELLEDYSQIFKRTEGALNSGRYD